MTGPDTPPAPDSQPPGSQLWHLVKDRLAAKPIRILGLSIAAGVANTAVLGVLGTAGERGSDHRLLHLALLLGAITVFAFCQVAVSRVTAREVEGVLAHLRIDLVNRIARTDLATFEQLGRARLLGALAGDVQTISAAAVPIVAAAQSALQLGLAVIYLFLLSKVAFILGTLGVTAAAFAYLRRLRLMGAKLAEAAQQDQETLVGVEDALRGREQLKQNSAASAALRADVDALSLRAAGTRREAQEGIGGMTLFGQIMFFFLLGAMIWELPAWGLGGPTVTRATMVLLFVLGAIGSVLQGVMTVAIAEGAAARLLALQRQLASLATEQSPTVAAPREAFRGLSLRGAGYRHRSASGTDGFTVGPIDLEIRPGELLFLTGGNGSGKSTLIKVLAGLYPPSSGVIRLDGQPVAAGDPALRESMAVVFSDPNVSTRLWGMPAEDEPMANALVERFGLAGSVTVRDGAFSTVALSTGQRKRLALITALLERRPLLILDEFAADQDPEFRRRFYTEILPGLINNGLTILAVTHDDDYFAVADRRVMMDEGRLYAIDPVSAAG
jgi:putative ATP-binding cassette transporter